MAKQIWIACLAAAMLLTGCRSRNPVGHPVVSQISVECQQGDTITQRVYTTQWKMRQILNHLRILGQKFTPFVDPDTISARTFRVSITLTDGSHRLYQIKADRYIRTGQSPWQQCDPEQLEALNLLLQELPGDQ